MAHKNTVTITVNWMTTGIVVVALIIGFFAGLAYEDHAKTTATAPTTLPQICNCPNIPVGENPSLVCRC